MWSLYEVKDGVERKLPPLQFSNKKTQEDVVHEVIDAVKRGERIISSDG